MGLWGQGAVCLWILHRNQIWLLEPVLTKPMLEPFRFYRNIPFKQLSPWKAEKFCYLFRITKMVKRKSFHTNMAVPDRTELITCNDEWIPSVLCVTFQPEVCSAQPSLCVLPLSVSTHNDSHLHPLSSWMHFVPFYKTCNFECLVFF
jgi:hypothetical protein